MQRGALGGAEHVPSDQAEDLPSLPGFRSDEPSNPELFAGKAHRVRDPFEEAEPVRESRAEAKQSAEAARRRRLADAFPEFDEDPAAEQESRAADARLAAALEANYAEQEYARKWQPTVEEDEPKVATAAASGASRRAAAARADAAQRGGGARTALVTIAVVVVVVLIGGVAAYYLRSVESAPGGTPPVIAADDGPVKVEPPKDQAAADEETVGEAVYDRVAGNAPAAQEQVVDNSEEPREVARIVLPSPQSDSNDALVRSVGGEDAATADGGQANGVEASDIGPRRVPTFTVRPDGTIVSSDDTPTASTTTTETPAPANAPAEEMAAAEPAPAASADELSAMAAAPADEAMTSRPAIEDSTAVAAVAPAAPREDTPVNLLAEAAPATTAGDGYLVQISSQRSMEEARSSYASMQRRYGPVLGKLEPVIQQADLGDKGIYYRVRVGPWASRDDAIQVCESLKAAGGNCYVTR